MDATLPRMSASPVHEWLTPRLRAMVREAETAGFQRQTVVAVITDLITGPAYNAPPESAPPEAPPEARMLPGELVPPSPSP